MSAFDQAISSLTDKNGKLLLPVVEDMKQRENPLLIVNLACDDACAGINDYIARQYADIAASGIALCAKAGNCREVIIYTGETNPDKMLDALKPGIDIPVSVISGPSSPVLRDESALYNAMDTGVIRVNRAELEYRRNFLSYGYQGRPSMVIDGETAYQAGRLRGNPGEALTKIVSVINDDAVMKEVPAGTSVEQLLENQEMSGAVLIGGTCGRFLKGEVINEANIGFEYEYDSIRVFKGVDCVVNELAGLYGSIQELSCAKCVMCREGSMQLAAIFKDFTQGRSNRDDIELIEDICPIIHAGALCSFGKNMVFPALTALSVCREEIEKHVLGRSCPAGRCRGLMKYIIDPALCTGCGECPDSCPEEAIEGKDGFIHIIDEKLCEKCGKCVDSCPEGAIKTDSGKIKTPKKPVKVGRFS